ncbi:MAG: hypothetical protein AAFY65_02195 [Pseudomonadota bacterium]
MHKRKAETFKKTNAAMSMAALIHLIKTLEDTTQGDAGEVLDLYPASTTRIIQGLLPKGVTEGDLQKRMIMHVSPPGPLQECLGQKADLLRETNGSAQRAMLVRAMRLAKEAAAEAARLPAGGEAQTAAKIGALSLELFVVSLQESIAEEALQTLKAAGSETHSDALKGSLVKSYKAASKKAMDQFATIDRALSWVGWDALAAQTAEFEREKLLATREAVVVANSAVLFLDAAQRVMGNKDPGLEAEMAKTCDRIAATSFEARCCEIGKITKDPRPPYAAASILARSKGAPEKVAKALRLAASLDGHTGPIEDFAPRWLPLPIPGYCYFARVLDHLSASVKPE